MTPSCAVRKRVGGYANFHCFPCGIVHKINLCTRIVTIVRTGGYACEAGATRSRAWLSMKKSSGYMHKGWELSHTPFVCPGWLGLGATPIGNAVDSLLRECGHQPGPVEDRSGLADKDIPVLRDNILHPINARIDNEGCPRWMSIDCTGNIHPWVYVHCGRG